MQNFQSSLQKLVEKLRLEKCVSPASKFELLDTIDKAIRKGIIMLFFTCMFVFFILAHKYINWQIVKNWVKVKSLTHLFIIFEVQI